MPAQLTGSRRQGALAAAQAAHEPGSVDPVGRSEAVADAQLFGERVEQVGGDLDAGVAGLAHEVVVGSVREVEHRCSGTELNPFDDADLDQLLECR